MLSDRPSKIALAASPHVLVAPDQELTPHPDAFLELVVARPRSSPGLFALSAGYECGTWRCRELADHLMEWLPEFALSPVERDSIRHQNMVAQVRRAARIVYSTDKYKRRGEFGELLLHIVIRQVFETEPAISKIFYKDSTNNTVKGFDAVHVVTSPDSIELWLGEAKFYADIARAMTSVVKELERHATLKYMREELALITNKIDERWRHAGRLKELIHPHVSLDKIFDRICVPVLLTYDSDVLGRFASVSDAFTEALRFEVIQHYEAFRERVKPLPLRLHLFLVPLATKALLASELHRRLQQWQRI